MRAHPSPPGRGCLRQHAYAALQHDRGASMSRCVLGVQCAEMQTSACDQVTAVAPATSRLCSDHHAPRVIRKRPQMRACIIGSKKRTHVTSCPRSNFQLGTSAQEVSIAADSHLSMPGRISIVTLESHGCAVDKAKSLMLNICRSSSSARQPHLLLLHTVKHVCV
jgi:hypothetical protein